MILSQSIDPYKQLITVTMITVSGFHYVIIYSHFLI